MRKIGLSLCILVTVAGCARISNSRINPLNWFGKSEPTPVAVASSEIRPLVPENRSIVTIDQRSMVDTITAASIERTNDGAILTATAVTIGAPYNAQLRLESVIGNTATYSFVAQNAGGNAPTAITVAEKLDHSQLASIRTIVINGANGGRQIRR